MKLKAIGPVSLKDGDKWLNWKDGEVFDPPAHMDVKKAIKRGIVVEVKKLEATRADLHHGKRQGARRGEA